MIQEGGLFLILILVIYFASRSITNELYYFLSRLIRSDKIVYSLISIIFLPGTILHEAAHFIVAIFLLLPVKKASFFPIFENNNIKLGSVTYEKKDPIRGILVGIAPFFAGLLLLFLIMNLNIFPNNNLFINILLAYLICIVTLTMFSSEKDLQDLAFAVPLVILIGFFFYAIIYIFNINTNVFFKNEFTVIFIKNIKLLNSYLILSIIIQGVMFLLLRLSRVLFKK